MIVYGRDLDAIIDQSLHDGFNLTFRQD